MCGIAGWVSFTHDLRLRQATIDSMTDTMSQRGPDAHGTWVREHVALGHRRLAVIDIEGGLQPMITETGGGSVALVYTGEVYNFVEVREELKGRGHRFRTRSDTEVVLRGYLEWGTAVPERLNGMFAFAVWDARTDELHLVRDRLGIKPLFFHPTSSGAVFGSEPKAILAHPDVQPVVDLDGLRELITFTRAPNWSLWRGIHEVEPGTVVSVRRSDVRRSTYWTLPTQDHPDDLPTTIERTRDLLEDTVRRQLIADVPFCVLLSGGLDSSSIAGFAARNLARSITPLRTSSVDFKDQPSRFRPDELRGTPDAPYVRDVVDMIASTHETITPATEDLSSRETRRKVIRAEDMPRGLGDLDSSLYLLFREIRQSSTVALSGESADEVFGGYPWFHRMPAIQGFPWIAYDRSITQAREEIFNFSVRKVLELDQYLSDQYASALRQVVHTDDASAMEREMRTAAYLHLTREVRTLLDRKDRLSMSVGLEVRVPYCDHRLVEYVYNTPWSFKNFDGREKSLLRHAAAPVLPRSVVDRKKSGYPLTQDRAYLQLLQQEVAEILDTNHSEYFGLIDRGRLTAFTRLDGATEITHAIRFGINLAIDLFHWLDMYRPRVQA